MGLNDINSLSHTKWNCKYHIVFAPKYRRGVELYGILEREEQYDVVRAVRRIEVQVSEP